MSYTATEYKYASPVFGNLAHDLGAVPMPGEPARETHRVRPDTAPEVSAPPRVRERAGTRAVPATRQAISPGAVLGFLVAAVLIVFSLFAQVQVTQLADESVALQQQLAELQTEQARLQIKYESVFNFNEIERYAMTEFGMQKPREGQMFYINSSAQDKVVILKGNQDSGGLLDRLSGMLETLAEYLR